MLPSGRLPVRTAHASPPAYANKARLRLGLQPRRGYRWRRTAARGRGIHRISRLSGCRQRDSNAQPSGLAQAAMGSYPTGVQAGRLGSVNPSGLTGTVTWFSSRSGRYRSPSRSPLDQVVSCVAWSTCCDRRDTNAQPFGTDSSGVRAPQLFGNHKAGVESLWPPPFA